MELHRLPPGQQLAAAGKWPLVGEREPASLPTDWSVVVSGLVDSPRTWSLNDLRSLPQETRTIDIHCVTRWSVLGAHFTGVPLSTFLDSSRPQSTAKFISFVAHSPRAHSTSLSLHDAAQLNVFIAWAFDGEPISREHGGPVRVVTPGRYFYKSLKWLSRVELLADDHLGYWEASAGYHNRADPWLEERYIASGIGKKEAAQILLDGKISGRELLGLDGSDRQLAGLQARGSLLRNANFARADLRGADFSGANLTNARFMQADLRDALFVNADLEGAHLNGSDLRGADLRGASLFGTSFVDTSPSSAAMLDATTRIDATAVDQLMPGQTEFIVQFLTSVP